MQAGVVWEAENTETLESGTCSCTLSCCATSTLPPRTPNAFLITSILFRPPRSPLPICSGTWSRISCAAFVALFGTADPVPA